MPELATWVSPTDDDRLNQAEGLVRSYCRWHIAPSRTETVTIRGNSSGIVVLPSLHVTNVASVTCDGTLLTNVTDYWWTEAGVLTRVGAVWSEAQVVVTFTHGYNEPPPEVTKVVQDLAQRGIANPRGATAQTAGPFAATFTAGLLDAETTALKPYQVPARF